MKASRFACIAEPERQRFAAPAYSLGFFLVLTLALVMAFPADKLLRRLKVSTQMDAVSMAYLHAWLHAKPDDYSLRLALARHQMQAGDLAGGQRTLAPVLLAGPGDAALRREADFLLLSIRERALWQTEPGAASYTAQRSAYLAQLRRVAVDTQDRERLQLMANTAFALGDQQLGRSLYERLIRDNPRASFGLLERLALMDVAATNYRQAAAVYFNILPFTTGIEQRRHYFLAGLHLLRAGNLLDEAGTASQALAGPLADDPETLRYLVDLALASGRTDVAAHLAARLLRQHIDPGKSA